MLIKLCKYTFCLLEQFLKWGLCLSRLCIGATDLWIQVMYRSLFSLWSQTYLFAFVETPINKQFVGWSFKKANIHISVASKLKLLRDLFVVGDELLGLNKEHTSCLAICVSSLCKLLTQVWTWNCNRGENMIRVCYDLAEDSQLFKT